MDGETTNLEALESALMARIARSEDEASLETVRVEALGKQGVVSGLMRNLGAMAPEERKAMGARLNEMKDRLGEALTVRKAGLAEAALEAKLIAEKVDVSLPPRSARASSLRRSATRRSMCARFARKLSLAGSIAVPRRAMSRQLTAARSRLP